MYAQVGDRLAISGGDHERIGLILKVPHADGTPPYVVKWLATGHIAMVMPGQFARIVRAVQTEATADDHRDAEWSGTKV